MLPDWFYRLPGWAVPHVAFAPGYFVLALPGIVSGFWDISLLFIVFLALLATMFGGVMRLYP